MPFLDAHNHLHDERFLGRQSDLVAACRAAGITRMVVNGSCEDDWPAVANLARQHPDLILPAFGLHPWYVHQRSPEWFHALVHWLDVTPGATVGEIGLDRWILETPTAVGTTFAARPPAPLTEQIEVFQRQLALASERRLPASLHCLQAWGPLFECLRATRPPSGVLLHSYGGPAEMVVPLARLGAYFGFPGYFLHARKTRQREVFRAVPADRLLAETDAPDQRLPPATDAFAATVWPAGARVEELAGPGDTPANHPVNLTLVYLGLAGLRRVPVTSLDAQLHENFLRLFPMAATPLDKPRPGD